MSSESPRTRKLPRPELCGLGPCGLRSKPQLVLVDASCVSERSELVDELDPEAFWQIHRSTLVNARAIDGITRDFRGRQLVGVKGLTEKLEVSRSYTHLFKGM